MILSLIEASGTSCARVHDRVIPVTPTTFVECLDDSLCCTQHSAILRATTREPDFFCCI